MQSPPGNLTTAYYPNQGMLTPFPRSVILSSYSLCICSASSAYNSPLFPPFFLAYVSLFCILSDKSIVLTRCPKLRWCRWLIGLSFAVASKEKQMKVWSFRKKDKKIASKNCNLSCMIFHRMLAVFLIYITQYPLITKSKSTTAAALDEEFELRFFWVYEIKEKTSTATMIFIQFYIAQQKKYLLSSSIMVMVIGGTALGHFVFQ